VKELIKEILKRNGLLSSNEIDGYFIGIELIKVKTSGPYCPPYLITICTSVGISDWYITDIYNLGGK
jgi:hypothetical protein